MQSGDCSKRNPHPYLGHAALGGCGKLVHQVLMDPKTHKPYTKESYEAYRLSVMENIKNG